MNITKVISSTIDSFNRRVVKVLRFGKSDVQTAVEAGPFGVDSNPIKDMEAIYMPSATKGKTVIVGYINKKQLAEPGEVRHYSTDDSGVEKFYTWLKKDGTMEIGGNTDNMVRFSELQTAFNQLKSDFNDLVIKFNTHVHPGVTAGGASTLVTATPGTASAADISDAKIDEIKTL